MFPCTDQHWGKWQNLSGDRPLAITYLSSVELEVSDAEAAAFGYG